MTVSDEVLYWLSGGWEKVQKCADVMYGSFQTSQGQPSAYDLISESMWEMIRWLTFGNV